MILNFFFALQTMGNLGSSDVDSRLEEQLIDGILYAFQEQTQEVNTSHSNCMCFGKCDLTRENVH